MQSITLKYKNDFEVFLMRFYAHVPLFILFCSFPVAVSAEAKLPSYEEYMKALEASRTYKKEPFDREKVIELLTTPSPSVERIKRILPWITSDEELILNTATEYFSSLPAPDKEELNSYINRLEKENLVSFPAGSFWMGDFGWVKDKIPVTSDTNDDPPFKVKLSSFVIMKQLVTYADYDLYTRAERSSPLSTHDYSYLRLRFPDYPAGGVTWKEAQGFCQWLGKITGKPFDLPTEAQWEYAARSGGREIFYASTPKAERHMGNMRAVLEEFGTNKSVSDTVVVPVKTFPPNSAGVYDMAGYGREWVLDWYGPYTNKPLVDPQGPRTGTTKVARVDSADFAHTAISRDSESPDKRQPDLNFRCAALQSKP